MQINPIHSDLCKLTLKEATSVQINPIYSNQGTICARQS